MDVEQELGKSCHSLMRLWFWHRLLRTKTFRVRAAVLEVRLCESRTYYCESELTDEHRQSLYRKIQFGQNLLSQRC